METDKTPMKSFISYSWTNQDHIEWMIKLASELKDYRVDVTLDKWDLKESHDSVAFMEKMVNDSQITKVLIISDKVYAEKANGRNGGVGTETQIISKEVYDNVTQDKFALVLVERDEEGKPCVPTYYKSRMYIDFTQPEKYTDSFEQLLRWIYDKPQYEKPLLGKEPAFLNENSSISLGTSIAFKRAIGSIKEGKSYSCGAIDEYFTLVSTNLDRFRIGEYANHYDDVLIDKIKSFTPYRNELIQVFQTICQYSPTIQNFERIHVFLNNR